MRTALGPMERFDGSAFLIQRDPRMRTASIAVLVLGVAIAAFHVVRALGLSVAWLGLGGVVYAWALSPGGTPLAVHLRADARGLFVDGRLVMPSSRIAGGWVQPRARVAPLVHVRGRWRGVRHLRFLVRNLEHGRCLLRALAIDATQLSASYWALARPLGEPRAFAHMGVLLGLTMVGGLLMGPAVPSVFALALVALVVLLVGIAAPTKVVVGADGVLLRWLGTSRFVSWVHVTDVMSFDGAVTLALGRQDWLTLKMPADHERYQPERDAMVERMRAALRAFGSRGFETETALPPHRAHDRPRRTRAWVRQMRALVIPKAALDYRTASVPVARLWRVVEDPRADRASRTGAAIALAQALDPAVVARLRMAASACAEPRLRIAIITAVDEAAASDEDLATALDAVERDDS